MYHRYAACGERVDLNRRAVTATRFLGEFFSKPTSTGAVTPSSIFLARAMVEDLNLPGAGAVLEYGPGTGVFTQQILEQVRPNSKFLAIELNPRLARIFRERHPTVTLVEDSVANARTICDRAGIEYVDCVVSGLPWASFSKPSQISFLDEMMRVLKPGGRFVTFAYVHGVLLAPARRFAALLPLYFRSVSRSRVIWLNLPPAFVYRCRK
jgi:phosphatidylethanolamine/phosphatidyl-N-methylethanolamine N-methyltransferase